MSLSNANSFDRLRRACGTLLILLGLPILTLSGCRTESVPKAPQRVIWISVDSLRADRLGAYGYPLETSPWIDEFAGKSVRFDWAMTPSNHTVRSVAGYLTGKPYTTIHANASAIGIPEREETLSEALQAAGVRTHAWTANLNLVERFGYHQGFDTFRVLAPPGRGTAYIDEVIADVRANYSISSEREFIYVHTMDIHLPYRPAHPFGARFAPQYSGSRVREGAMMQDNGSTQLFSTHPYWSGTAEVTDDDVNYLQALYDGSVAYTDSKLPELLAALEWDPDRDLVILTSDHGEHLFEEGWWSHFATLTPREIRVPLIINFSGFQPQSISNQVGLMDLYPTILDLLGIAPPDGLFGSSLAPALKGEALPNHFVYSETSPKNGLSAVVISDTYWYWVALNRSQIEPWHPWPYAEHLFRYRDDPDGVENLAETDPAAADAMNQQLRDYNPRWARFTPDRIRGNDESVTFGDNLLHPLPTAASLADEIQTQPGGWTVNVDPVELRFVAADLTPYEPLFLEMEYDLEAGRILLEAPQVEYLLPARGLPADDWRHELTRQESGARFSSVIVPLGDRIELRLQFDPETRSQVRQPTLRKMRFDRVEPWPQLPESRDPNFGMDPELVEQLKTLGYLQ